MLRPRPSKGEAGARLAVRGEVCGGPSCANGTWCLTAVQTSDLVHATECGAQLVLIYKDSSHIYRRLYISSDDTDQLLLALMWGGAGQWRQASQAGCSRPSRGS